MRTDFNPCWSFTSEAEGGYSSSARDPGNWTGGVVGLGWLVGSNHGISAPMLLSWLGAAGASLVSASYMQSLPLSTACAIYAARTWNVLCGGELQPGVDVMVVDFGYNAGDSASAEMLQGLLGVAQDGSIGPLTLGAQAGYDAPSLIDLLSNAQTQFYSECSEFALYGDGWLARTVARTSLARSLAGSVATSARAPFIGRPQPRPVRRTKRTFFNGG